MCGVNRLDTWDVSEINGIAYIEKFELLSLTGMKMKENGENSWWGVTDRGRNERKGLG